jgi:hypothetical protein
MPDRGPIVTQRLEEIITGLQGVVSRIRPILDNTQIELFDFAEYEAQFTATILAQELPIEWQTTLPSFEQLRAAVVATPFDGRNLQEWYNRLDVTTQDRLSATIKRGYVEGRATQQIVADVAGGQFLDVTRRNVEAVVRTSISHTANVAREQFFSENTEIIKGVRYIATLDDKEYRKGCSCLDRMKLLNAKLEKAESGEMHMNSKLYDPIFTPLSQMGDFGLGFGLYFATLRAVAVVTFLGGLVSLPNILYFRSSGYSNGQEGVHWALKGSVSVCSCIVGRENGNQSITHGF